MKLHVSAFIGHHQVSTIIKMSLYKLWEGVLIKRSLCINRLFTLFLVQILYVNNGKVLGNWKYGDRGFRPGAE